VTANNHPSQGFRKQVLDCLSKLERTARLLTRDSDAAEELVQDTLLCAFATEDRFTRGTNLNSWLHTILRHRHISNVRAARHAHMSLREVPSSELLVAPTQISSIEQRRLRRALMDLVPAQREALLLVVLAGCSHEEAAEICRCPVGTIKSRISRAKLRIAGAHDALEHEPRPVVRHSHAEVSFEGPAGLRVLIVEDELLIANEYVRMLGELGAVPIGKAARAVDASRFANAGHPDVVIMDIHLRGMPDGIAAAHAINALRPTSVLFVTAYDDEDTRRRIKAFNGSEPLLKPVEKFELGSALVAQAQRPRH
jgi:RNA polymerase sigma-70 factor (ECF subfamily)